ncbi:hypothetical protein DYB32_000051 [Aphanomyces invadans]|uniref:Uncharacterized protein n=1 Tax=Aphanomyces invadans TaxID=157072 RepID=A0A3R7D809_9STRA|nr:hypothetical protein DYB32_000051 [Aphanomyces invadans]
MCKHTTQIDFWNINADTPLVWACIEGRDAAVAVLLRHGADPRVTNHYGATTLMCATMIGEESDEATDAARKAIVTMLLERCPELVNVQDRDGSTAMHLAASCGYLQCCHALLAGGADITIRNAVGQTPLEEAEQTGCEGSEPCVAFLKVHWAKLEEEVNKRMRTMLELEDDPSLGVATPGKSAKKKKKQKKNSAAKKKQQLANKPATPPPNAFNTHSLPAAAATRDIDDDDDSDASDEQVKLGSQTNRTVQASTTGLQAVQVPQPAVEEDAWTTVCRKQSHEKKDAGKHQPVTPHGVGLEQSDATHIASEVHSMKPASTAPQTHTQPTFPPIAQRLMREVDEEIAPTHRVTPESLVVPPTQAACVGLVAIEGDPSTGMTKTLASLEEDMHTAVPLSQHVALSPVGLVPGQTPYLASCSMAQLDVLEEMHYTALREIQSARVATARAQERMRYDQELKQQLYLQSLVAPVFAAPGDDTLLG